MKSIKYALLVFVVLIWSCKGDTSKLSSADGTFNVKESDHTGITFANDLKDNQHLNIVEYLYYYNGGGVGVGDINQDGLEDLFFCGNQTPNKLYLNKGNLQFEDITEKSGILDDHSWSTGVAIDDVNGDGLLDIYVCNVSLFSPDGSVHNMMYINKGDGTFDEKSKEYGLAFVGFSTHASFLDYDQDGDLDMYLLNHNIHSVNSYGNIERRTVKDSLAGDVLYENQLKESGKFVDVTAKAGIYSSSLGYGLGVSVVDINNDGWVDIYVGNDFHENDYLYINNGNKTFTESIEKYCSHTSQFSMGVDIADVNNDSWPDIFTTDMMPFSEEVMLVSGGEDSDQIKQIKKDFGFYTQAARNHFQINQQNGSFSERALITKTFATDWSWSVLLQDFDNDGRSDIFISNGIVKRPNDLDYINYLNELDNKNPEAVADRTAKLIGKMPSQPMRNILFKQQSLDKFTQIENSEVGPPSFSTGAAYVDLDNDGDLDVVTNNINQKAFIYDNVSSPKSYLTIKLKGNEQFPNTKGTKVIAFANAQTFTCEKETTRGFMSSSTHSIHFGLGDAKSIDSLVISWPGGFSQTILNPKTNQILDLVRPRTEELTPNNVKIFKPEQAIYLPIKHKENKYFDENMEKLIPERLSTEGPAIITEDLNGDGRIDIFLGGGRGQPAQLFFGAANGSFALKETSDFDKDAGYEDTDAATIDFDGDGDRDLYVVSGGGDLKELDKKLEDRIYLNNGKGVFKRIPLSLPHTNGSTVAVADFDKDGFEDIFVGARSIPGSYGLSPYSFLLKNLNGQGVDIAFKTRFGMVTDAQWADLDGDKNLELILCGDWMNVTILGNTNGKWSDKSADFGTDVKRGFWNTVECTDVNKDGILDILVGNSGQNTKWTATDSMPIKMFVGDFDSNGNTEPIIFYHYISKYIPFGSLGLLSSQLPILKKKFSTYSSFKNVQNISDLIEKYQDKVVEDKSVNELRSIMYLSEGKKYVNQPLNDEEQMSDIQDFLVLKSGEIIYIGNQKSYVADLGPCTSNPGRIIGKFDLKSKAFTRSSSFELPMNINARKIVQLDNTKLLVATNDDYIYLLNTK